MRRFLFALLAFALIAKTAYASPPLGPESKADYEMAMQHLKNEEYDEAIDSIQKILKSHPDQAPLYNLLGIIYLKQNTSIKSAIGSFEEAVRLDPNYADAYFNLASAYATNDYDPNKAADYFKKTLEVDPKYEKAYFGLGWFTLTSKQNPEEAAEYFQKAVERFPDFAEAYYGLGMCYIQMGKSSLTLGPISSLREMRRDDLAANLELVLRGGKLPDQMVEDNAPASAAPSAPASPPAAASAAASKPSSKEPAPTSEAPKKQTSTEERRPKPKIDEGNVNLAGW